MNLEDVLIRDTRANQPLATAVAEGSLYFVTDESVTEQSRGGAWVNYSDVGGGLAINELTGDVTAGPGAGSQVATITDEAVTNAKLAHIDTARIKGRVTAATGDVEDLTGTQTTTILDNMIGDSGAGGTKGLVPAPAAGDAAADKFLKADATWEAIAGGISELTGDVLAGPGSGSEIATIAGGAVTTGKILNKNVTFNKLPDISNTNLLGRGSMGTDPGDVEEILLGTGLAISGTTLNVTTEIKAQVARVVLTDAQIKSGFTVPITIVAAPSAGQIIVPFEYTFIKETSSGAYVSPCNLLFRFAGSGIDLFTALNWFPTAANKRWGKVGTAQTGVIVGAAPPFATALQVLLSADNTGGNAANYLAFELLYIIMEDGP
jgi:hypothetical protein